MNREFEAKETKGHRLNNWLIGVGVATVLLFFVVAFMVGGRVSISAGEVEMQIELVKGEGVALTFSPLDS